MAEDLIVPVDFGSAVPKPSEENIAHRGPRRLVKLVPTPFGSRPAIWTGPPREEQIENEKVIAFTCAVLLQKDPLQVVAVTVPRDFYEKLPDVPVEW